MKNLAKGKDDGFGKAWIIENGKSIIETYYGTPITVRQLYYRLVADLGFPNGQKFYKRVVSAMTSARKDGDIPYDAFVDREREPYGSTMINRNTLESKIETGKWSLRDTLRTYGLNSWHFQTNYIEVWIEKKALQGVFESPCLSGGVGLFACKGYPSLTSEYEAYLRFLEADEMGKELTLVYFGDHDPSGDDIPRSIIDTLAFMGVSVTLDRRALTKDQVIEMGLPPAPTKATDSRTASWDGLGQVELDAVKPELLVEMVKTAIDEYIDEDEYEEYKTVRRTEKAKYVDALTEYVTSGEFEGDI